MRRLGWLFPVALGFILLGSLAATPVHAGEMLGWLDEDGLEHLLISGGSDNHPPAEFFRVEGGQLYPRRAMHIFMATTRPDIAASDCLFYFIPED